MANQAAKMFAALLDAQGMTHRVMGDDDEVIRTGWNLDNTKLEIFFFFFKDSENVHIEGHDFIKIPKEKEDKFYKICNDLNKQYRWFKFTLNTERHELVLEDDAIIQLDSCAEEVFELMLRMTHVVDEVFPECMKALYA